MLCKQNPNKRCTGNFAHKYWVGDKLLAKCEGEIQVRRKLRLLLFHRRDILGTGTAQRSRCCVSKHACKKTKGEP